LARRNLAIIYGNIAQGRAGLPPHVAAYEQALWAAEQELPREEQIALRRLGGPFDAGALYERAALGAAALSGEGDGCELYMVRDQQHAVKIGQARRDHAERRIGCLQTGQSSKLEVLLIVPGVYGHSELILHHAFKEDRIRGEWFLDTARIDRFATFARFAWLREQREPTHDHGDALGATADA
jgi:hypothetical protein